ncbi:MAG: hypothetical protein HXY41_07520 [Chloroflexi bacterium]|nr:hypothetical protein [Chloroflexota bacterium]
MAANTETKVQAFKAQVQEKIQKLVAEFAAGSLSREQFHAIYERYTGQLTLADMALQNSSPEMMMGVVESGPSTIAIRDAHMGKAIGMVIYNNRTGMLVETLGDFDVPPAKLAPILNDFTLLMESGRLVEREVRAIGPKQWLLFAAGKFTTVVTLFRNEPAELQMREIERLHHDFEQANHAFFGKGTVDSSKLAYPFLVFVQKKIRQA